MDLFKFDPIDGTRVILKNGQLIDKWKSLMWVERYRDAGEFELKANPDSPIRQQLPPGTLISHINTEEVMIVENHEVTYDGRDLEEVKITGRSFETFLENRIVGENQDWVSQSFPPPEYILTQAPSWVQAVELISDHIVASNLLVTADTLYNVGVSAEYSGPQVFAEQRTVRRGDVYSAVLELLDIDKFGIRTIRTLAGETGYPGVTLHLHKGLDKTSSVAFSHTFNELESANYLWSIKNLKNAALVSGRWAEVLVESGPNFGYDRRTMWVDASDLDNNFNGVPSEPELSQLLDKMRTRGRQALASQNYITISNEKVKDNANRYKYREDYYVGDIVSVEGAYNTSSVLRVLEHVEIEDEKGSSSYPTLGEI